MSVAVAPLPLIEREKYADCVHCGLCLSACPTYAELGTEMDSPRGRIYLLRDLAEGRLDLTSDVVRHLDLCLGCRACETACPSGVRYGRLIESAREYVEAAHPRPWTERWRRALIKMLLPHPQRLRLLLLPLRALEVAGVLDVLRRRSALLAMLPRLGWWEALPEVWPSAAGDGRRVALFTGCVQQVLFAETNRATARVLARNRFAVQAPARQTCCGALYLHAGDRQGAQACARRNIDAFPEDIEAIAVNAAGCGAMLKEYGDLLADDPAYASRASAFSARTRDVTELLAAAPLVAPRVGAPRRVTYHDACHLAHAQGVRAAPRQLLQQIPGLELVELEEADVCCGSAGSYNLTEPAMARRLGARKAEHVRDTHAEIVAVANPGCAMQIQAELRRCGSAAVVRHPVELLDEAYRDASHAT